MRPISPIENLTALSAVQQIALLHAAARSDHALLPLPQTLKLYGAARDRLIEALIARGLTEECNNIEQSEACPDGVLPPKRIYLTAAALALTPAPTKAPEPPTRNTPSKQDQILTTLSSDEGLTPTELTAMTGWLPHTARAAISRLRQKGHQIELGICEGRKAYRLIRSEGGSDAAE